MRLQYSLALVAATAIAPGAALATNGYFAHGYGTINKGMAGAGTALGQDSIAAATNPAGMAFVGDRMDGGFEIFSPRRQYEVEGTVQAPPAFSLQPGTYKSSRNGFVIPHLGFNRQVTDEHTLGVSVFANGGMNTSYPGKNGGPFYGGRTGVDLKQVFIAPTWSWEFADNQAFGISPLIAYQQFEAKGLSQFAPFSSDPDALTDNGTDDAWGYGFQIGWQGEITDTLRGGVSWRNILHMNEFDKYQGLFARQGDFDIPQMFKAGIAWSGIQDHWILLDVQHIRYSEIDSVGNPLLPNLQTAQLGNDDGAGFGWDDMTAYKLGWQWQQTREHAWRAGISYGKNPISSEDVLFNILAPGVQEWHVTGGFTHNLTADLQLSGMVFYSPAKEVKGPNPLSPNQTIALEMYQVGASASVGWSF
ncbi:MULTISPECIES: OmpP1/FadL family transporter [Marinobacter]|uniref:Outer membrane protein transport protein n=1 Tax=Marinobacter suaedae TaxID=3057675 RepID=A0ABT8VXN3_9GAMM|nr:MULTISPECIES: outer membrane protein transport protein [unclassified Marinobacter]MBZ2168844.1 outer membrane protein transport protein [Marinobacter sp. F4216]MDO3720719.1 outer membrane protein transport protein [Marinobacter sp. chi1]